MTLLASAVAAVVLLWWAPAAASAATPVPHTAPAVTLDSTPSHIPSCPPDCGRVGAGDPLLVPYLVANPGPGWLALPAAAAQSYADSLAHYFHGRGPAFNVADGRWVWANGRFDLVVALVASDPLAGHGLGDPARNAEELCKSTPGVPTGRLERVAGIPGSVVGICELPTLTRVPGRSPVAASPPSSPSIGGMWPP